MQWGLFLLMLMCQCSFFTCHLYEYHFVKLKKNWTGAQQYCRDKFTDLITVSNMTDMNRVSQKSESGWIGLQNIASKKWHWSLPGVEFNESETNWFHGEPNDKDNNENCARNICDGGWQDVSCHYEYEFYCYHEKNNSFIFIDKKMSWIDAQNHCREHHTDLVSGFSQFKAYMDKTDKKGQDYLWIGLYRDSWRWSDGSSFSFRHWEREVKEEHTCAMKLENEKWSSGDCNSNQFFFCYKNKVILVKQNKTWVEALYYCRKHHNDLVTITTLDDQRWVQETAKNANSSYIWLGLRYTCTLDFWFWVSDEVVNYTNWASNESDECNLSVAMERSGRYQWYKKNDAEEFNFICYR
ncbi:hypothetical protein PAMP_015874 [Pampus punctatissimus]